MNVINYTINYLVSIINIIRIFKYIIMNVFKWIKTDRQCFKKNQNLRSNKSKESCKPTGKI